MRKEKVDREKEKKKIDTKIESEGGGGGGGGGEEGEIDRERGRGGSSRQRPTVEKSSFREKIAKTRKAKCSFHPIKQRGKLNKESNVKPFTTVIK